MTGDTSRPEPLQGGAAREALSTTLEQFTTLSEGVRMAVVAVLLATGRVLVLPEPEPPCVEGIGAEIYGVLPSLARESARRIHAASLCSCAADALLRRWVDEWPGSSVSLSRDTSKYLEGR